MFEFKLPDIGEGLHEAEVLEWLVRVGDVIKPDQAIVDIQTDKATVQLPAPVGGTIAEIRIPAGKIARVGEVLVAIAPDHEASERQAVARAPQHSGPAGRPTAAPAQANGVPVRQARVLAAPAVRKLALQLGVDLAQVPGSGPAGRILPEDMRRFVEAAAQSGGAPAAGEATTGAPPPTAAPVQPHAPAVREGEMVEREPLQGLRRRIAERMELAWRVPHVTSFEEVDATNLVRCKQILQDEAAQRGVRLTYTALIVKLTVLVLKAFPYFNASLDMERKEILLHRACHVGVATAIPEGLVVPVLRNADRLTVLQIAAELDRLAEGARQRTLKPEELSGSTFTITNFGSFGGQQGTPIINPPEVAILGCGRIEEKAVVVQGQLAVRQLMPLALSFDHRLIDGAAAARFLGRLKALLATPELLLLDLA